MEASQWRSVEFPRLSHRHISALKGVSRKVFSTKDPTLIPFEKLQSAAVLELPDCLFLTPPTALENQNEKIFHQEN